MKHGHETEGHFRYAPAMVGALLLVATAAHAQKTDIIVLDNGDRYTGEIKGLTRGILEYSTDAASTVNVEWPKIQSVHSTKTFQFTLQDGRLPVGSLPPSPTPGRVLIATAIDTVDVPLLDVTAITRIKPSVWDRIDGSVDLGFDFTQENTKLDVNLTVQMSYAIALNSLYTRINGTFTSQESVSDIRQGEVALGYRHDIGRHWLFNVTASAQTNSQLSLDLRTSLALGPGRTLVASEKVEFSAWLGLGASRERFETETTGDNTLNGILGADFELFTFSGKKSNISAQAMVVPVLSQWGRVRLGLNGQVKQEVVNNLYLNFSITENFDSEPPTDANKNALSFTTSVGWSF